MNRLHHNNANAPPAQNASQRDAIPRNSNHKQSPPEAGGAKGDFLMEHKTRTRALSWLFSLAMLVGLLPAFSSPALAADGDTTYTLTIPSTLNVANSGWNATDGISATGTLASGKKLTVTASSANSWALKQQDGNETVSYTMKETSDGAAKTAWEFTTLPGSATLGIDVADYSSKPAGTYQDTVTFTASVEDAVVTHTTLSVGDVIHLGEVLSISTDYYTGGQAIQSSKSPFTLVRANVNDDPSSGTTVTEAENGQYYVLKGNDGSYCVYLGTPGTSKVEATSTSDGIIVNTLNGNGLYFTTHEPQ